MEAISGFMYATVGLGNGMTRAKPAPSFMIAASDAMLFAYWLDYDEGSIYTDEKATSFIWGSRRYRRKMYGKRSFGPPTPAPHRSWLIIPALTSVVLQRRPASAVLRCVRSLTAGQWPTY